MGLIPRPDNYRDALNYNYYYFMHYIIKIDVIIITINFDY